jgi:hypothetical protein
MRSSSSALGYDMMMPVQRRRLGRRRQRTLGVDTNGNSFENQLLQEGYQLEIENAIKNTYGTEHLDTYIKNLHGESKKKGIKRDYAGNDGRTRAILDFLAENKARMALPIAVSVVKAEKSRRVPQCARHLFLKIGTAFNLPAVQ